MRVLSPDPPKRAANLAKHKLDLARVDLTFFVEALVYPAKQGRWLALAPLDGRVTALVFQRVGSEAITPISLRPASRKERRLYVQTRKT